MSRLALYFLGAPRVEWNGSTVEFDTRKAVALLAYLAISGEAHTRDSIAALLWPEYDQPHARAALRRTLSVMHKTLGEEGLEIGREQVRLAPGLDLWLDVAEFQRLLPGCVKEGPESKDRACSRCTNDLKRAVDLYRDDFLAGFTLRDSAGFDDWQFFQSESLRSALSGALASLASCLAGLGDFEGAILYARRWLALDNLNEEAHRQLMRLYAWANQRNAALRQYRECARILEEQLGVEPLEETQALYGSILENRLEPPPNATRPPAPLQIFELAQASESGSGTSSSALPLVGRQTEWQALLNAYLKASNGYLVALEGEAGIGKSRLAEDLAVHVAGQGGKVALVRSYEGEAGLAYAPFMEAIRLAFSWPGSVERLKALSPAWLGEASRLLPELSSLLPEAPILAPVESPGAQARFFEGVRQALVALFTGERPGLLALDDLHWADSATLDLLAYILRRLRGSRLLALLSWRAETSPAQSRLHRMVAEAQRQGYASLISLRRLTLADLRQLIQVLRESGRDLPGSLGERLYREAEGLPLFVTEYLAAIGESGPEDEAGKWDIPSSVRGLLEMRLAAVDETGQQLLSTAAAIGRSFDFDSLRLASGRSEAETIAGLEALTARGLIREDSQPVQPGNRAHGPTYDFSHQKLRDLVYEKISVARQRLLHRRVAEALTGKERGHPEPGSAAQIAAHYHQAGESDLAAEYARIAADYARSLYANAEALRLYRLALEDGYQDRAGLHEAIGDLLTLLGEYSAAIESYHSSLDESGGSALARLEHKLGNVYHRRGEWANAEAHFEAALQSLESQAGDRSGPVEKANLLADWSRTAHHSDQPERAFELARQALTLAETSSDLYALALANNILGILARGQGEFQEASQRLERSLELAEQIPAPGARIAALNNLALVYADCGETAKAIDLAEKALQLCTQQGDRHREAALHNNLADLYHAAGQPERAMQHLKQAVVIFAEIGEEAGSPMPEVWMLTEW